MFDSSATATGTSRGCVLMTTKPVANEGSWDVNQNAQICHQPSNMNSADGSLIAVVAYNKSVRTNLASWGAVMVTSVANTATQAGLVPVVTINAGTLVTGSPLVFVENAAIAKILQVPAIGTNGVAIPNTAVLDSYVPMPRGASPAMALVVQEVKPPATILTVSPAIAWKVSQTGSR
jgi:hypothetical protein